ncbi:hypothetical protein AGMMS50256_07360 [Betaproteobacteria bacterium]|nr:hypothetical protein AGMMS50256_07360 [Betaproteobacteria bacterium]
MSANFDEFIRSQVESSTAVKIDLEKNKGMWLLKLDELYQLIEESLRQYIDKGNIQLEYKNVSLSEELLGTYDAKAAYIKVGRHVVKLDPIGTFLIGARGRVDMTGPNGIVRFVIVPPGSSGPNVILIRQESQTQQVPETPPENWVWKISTPPPRITYIDLTDESFRSSLMGVVDG